MPKKTKLTLDDLKVQSFATSSPEQIKGGMTGNCLSFIRITCPDPNCDFESIPFDECSWCDCPCSGGGGW